MVDVVPATMAVGPAVAANELRALAVTAGAGLILSGTVYPHETGTILQAWLGRRARRRSMTVAARARQGPGDNVNLDWRAGTWLDSEQLCAFLTGPRITAHCGSRSATHQFRHSPRTPTMASAERWAVIHSVLTSVLELPAAARAAQIPKLCGDDVELFGLDHGLGAIMLFSR
jgi:hypothetical protein